MDIKPSPADILVAIGKIAAGDWIDPCYAPPHWYCVLYDEHGKRACDGNAYTAAEAMALAWIGWWAPRSSIPRHSHRQPLGGGEGYRDLIMENRHRLRRTPCANRTSNDWAAHRQRIDNDVRTMATLLTSGFMLCCLPIRSSIRARASAPWRP